MHRPLDAKGTPAHDPPIVSENARSSSVAVLSVQMATAVVLLSLGGVTTAAGPVFVDLAANARDARAVASNPAAMAELDRPSWRAGAIVSYSESTWESTSSGLGNRSTTESDSTLVIPSVFYVRPLDDRWTIGASLSATGGAGDDGNDASISRYLSKEWSLGSFTFQPSIAYRLNDAWSIGGAVGVNYTKYTWEAAVFNGIGQPDGEVELDTGDVSLNYILSAHWRPGERTRFGISYRSQYDPTLKDSPSYSGVDPSRQSSDEITISATLPQSVLLGMRHDFDDGQWISLDVLWIETSAFELSSGVIDSAGRFIANPFQLDDTWAASIGWGRPLNARWSAGLGALYLHDPVDDESRSTLLRIDSLWGIGGGLEYKYSGDLTIGANLSVLFAGDAPVTTPNLPIVGTISGKFTDRTNLLFEAYATW